MDCISNYIYGSVIITKSGYDFLISCVMRHTTCVHMWSVNNMEEGATAKIKLTNVLVSTVCKDANYNLIACGYDCMIKDTCTIINYHVQYFILDVQ